MIFFTVVAAVTSLLIVASVVSHVRARRATNMTWDELVAKIQPVESDAVAAIALDHLTPTKNQLQFEPEELWKLVRRSRRSSADERERDGAYCPSSFC
jgi:hypothetical protein